MSLHTGYLCTIFRSCINSASNNGTRNPLRNVDVRTVKHFVYSDCLIVVFTHIKYSISTGLVVVVYIVIYALHCRAMLCIMPMPSCGVRLSLCPFVWLSVASCILSKRVKIFSKLFHRRVATSSTFSIPSVKTIFQQVLPLMEAPISRFIACCQRFDHQVL